MAWKAVKTSQSSQKWSEKWSKNTTEKSNLVPKLNAHPVHKIRATYSMFMGDLMGLSMGHNGLNLLMMNCGGMYFNLQFLGWFHFIDSWGGQSCGFLSLSFHLFLGLWSRFFRLALLLFFKPFTLTFCKKMRWSSYTEVTCDWAKKWYEKLRREHERNCNLLLLSHCVKITKNASFL